MPAARPKAYIGKAAPWFILGIMLFSYAVRAIYVESCSMFVRGGVYRVVKEAMGGTLAKFSVSALMFDYILTGPISGVSAGQYIVGLFNETSDYIHLGLHISPDFGAACFAILCTALFLVVQHQGSPRIQPEGHAHHADHDRDGRDPDRLVHLHRLCLRHPALPPFPHPRNLKLGPNAMGWLYGVHFAHFAGIIAIFVGLGHSVLAMSGEESLAQVYREIEHPKLPNLKKTGLVIFIYSLVFTSLVSFFAVMIIPDEQRQNFLENLIGGLAMNLEGPFLLRLVFHGFVVVVGTMILAGAVNTAIVGSNGVLNRVSEDGVLSSWFRQPHRRFGTSYRIINIIAALQIITIIISRGDVTFLANLYAFGVIWSFAMKGMAVLVLRYTHPGDREYRVPLNFNIFGVEIPLGLGLITLTLFGIAVVNLFTKKDATIAGWNFLHRALHRLHDFRKNHASRSDCRAARRNGSVPPGDGRRTDARGRGSAAGKHSRARQQYSRSLSSGERAGSREAGPAGCGRAARALVAAFGLR